MPCVYQGCERTYHVFTSTNFFNLPSDNRREIWIQNSGNLNLKLLPPNKKVQFCEAHFDPKFFRRQFNRTTLRRDAVPYNYYETNECVLRHDNISTNSSDITQEEKDKDCNKTETYEPIGLVSVVNISNLLQTDNMTNDLTDHLEEDYLEDQPEESELVEIIEPLADGLNESMTEEMLCMELEKTFVNSCTQTDDFAQRFPVTNEYDEDEHFILSLIGPLRRLPNHMKVFARLSILKIFARCESETMYK